MVIDAMKGKEEGDVIRILKGILLGRVVGEGFSERQ